MKIGIDASRAFLRNRTGIEEYAYQIIKHLRDKLSDQEVFLYLRSEQSIDFDVPEKWKIKKLKCPRLWTQFRLSWELILHPIEVLFVPSHIVPLIHPKNTIVTIHGLEYEFCFGAYSWWEKIYMRFSIKNSCRWAKKIISVSENTKNDLMKLYGIPQEKIAVVYEGYNQELIILDKMAFESSESAKVIQDDEELQKEKYLLFIGRLEERKNISGIIRTFDILKGKYNIPHKLFLVGKPGYGYEKIKQKEKEARYKNDIFFKGYVGEKRKWQFLRYADIFIFVTFYEGFGIPILEAQSMGVPVIASNVSSIPEISNQSTLLVDPNNPEEIAEVAYLLINNQKAREDIVKRGYDNIKRFSWENCAKEIAKILV